MTATVEPGASLLVREGRRLLLGRRYGLVCNAASILPDGRHLLEALTEELGCLPEVVFLPEHGFSYAYQYMEPVPDSSLGGFGVPARSLYGIEKESLAPSREELGALDVLVFDLQDVGARYYTYLASMALCLEAAQEAGVEFVVLDRPNPLGLWRREGNVVEEDVRSFVGYLPVRNRHGLSAGEAARLWAGRLGVAEGLVLLPCGGLTRDLDWWALGLPFVAPSPNMPDPETALLYVGMCLLEGTNVSEGRGTTMPFKVFGAPWVRDPGAVASRLNAMDLPGVRFLPVEFVPSADKYAGQSCRGARVVVVDRVRVHSLALGMAVVHVLATEYPDSLRLREGVYEFESDVCAIDLLLGSRGMGDRLLGGDSPWELVAELEEDLSSHELELHDVLIYGDAPLQSRAIFGG